MLADLDVVLDAAQRVAIRLSREQLAAGGRSRWRCDLQYKSLPRFIPSKHAL